MEKAQCWEYRVLTAWHFTDEDLKKNRRKLQVDDSVKGAGWLAWDHNLEKNVCLEDSLRGWGDGGWELAGVQSPYYQVPSATYIFKRPKSNA